MFVPRLVLLWVLSFGCLALSTPLPAQSDTSNPVLPPIDYHPEATDNPAVGKWSIFAPTLAGWHYSLEKLAANGVKWEALPDGQFYGNGQTLKYFVKEGPMPSNAPVGPPPPPGTPTWQLRIVTFNIEMQKDGLSSSFRIRRDAAVQPPGPPAVAAWDATLTDPLPPMPVGTRYFLFQSWDDPVAKIMWNTEFHVTVSANAPPAESLPTTPQQAAELNVFQQVKSQLLGAMTTPYVSPPPVPPGPKSLIRLRRTAIDSNHNGIFDWWEIANNFPALAPFNPNTSDPDGDGLSTLQEFQLGTNPRLADTDGDGLSDGAEVAVKSNPLIFNMPEFTLVSAWRKVQVVDTSERPANILNEQNVKAIGTGGGTSAGSLTNTHLPTSALVPNFPWVLNAAAGKVWNPFIPEPSEPMAAHDMKTPLYASRQEYMHGDGSYIVDAASPNSQRFSNIDREAFLLERTVRIKATRAMKVA